MAIAKISAAPVRVPVEVPSPEILQRRLALGRQALRGPSSRHHLTQRKAPDYFRTYEQLESALYALAAKYPNLVEIIDIGDSSEKKSGKADRDILALRLTSKKVTTAKPGVLFIGGQHAREIANPALLMRYADWLLSGYGNDAQATALLESRVIDLVPMMNPDGHAVVERGYAGESDADLDKRKNTSGEDGVDLNRNWASKHWGANGASHSPHAEDYCGPSPASEPEVQALQSFITASKPSLIIDWHSFSELVLYPPEDDAANTVPDQDHFERVGKKFATYNGYTAEKSVELYPTSGTSFWAYERFGIPSFTIETGVAFHQSDLTFEDTWKLNFAVMKYATAIADDWRKTSAGPEISRATLGRDGVLTIKAFDRVTRKRAAAAEVFLDRTTAPGTGKRASATSPGLFTASLTPSAGADKQLAYVRAMDADGHWGPLKALWLGAATALSTQAA